MQKSTPLACAALMLALGLLILPPLFSAAKRASVFTGPISASDLTIGRSHALFSAFEQYVQDYDERLPPMSNAAVFDAAVAPYVRNPATFLSADTGNPFQPNTALNGLGLYELNLPVTTAVFSDSAPGEPTIVMFADGHVEKDGVETGDPVQVSIGHARNLALAIGQYTQDYDEVLPPMQTQPAFESAVSPFVHSFLPFTDNLTGSLFVPNPALSGVQYSSITGDPANIVVVTSAQAAPDGYKTIAYLDGHAVHGGAGQPMASDTTNVRRLLLGVLQYAQDNDEALPPLQSQAAFSAAVLPYVRTSAVFTDPLTGQLYSLNAALSGLTLFAIENPSDTWVIRDSVPNPDGSLNVGYADGHVKATLNYVSKTLAIGADNVTHLVWAKADGTTAFTTLSHTGAVLGNAFVPTVGGQVAGYGVAPDGTQRLLFNLGSGAETLEGLDAAGNLLNTSSDGPYDGWTPGPLTVSTTGRTFVLWQRYDGTFALRVLASNGTPLDTSFLRFPIGWSPQNMAASPDGSARILLSNLHHAGPLIGPTAVLNVSSTGATALQHLYGNVGFTAVGLAVGPDAQARLLWAAPNGQAQLWTLTSNGTRQRSIPFAADPGWTPIGVSVGPDGNARLLWRDNFGNARIRFVSPIGVTLTTQDYAPPT